MGLCAFNIVVVVDLSCAIYLSNNWEFYKSKEKKKKRKKERKETFNDF